MSFASAHFLLFFPAVLVLYWSLRRSASARLLCLLIASYYFYMSWNVMYAGLILGSTILDFFIARKMGATPDRRARKALLIFSLCGNLGVLFVFKYYNFFMESFQSLAGVAGEGFGTLTLLLPVGISFYTFQTLSYTIDVYRRKIEPTGNFVKFALFVSFFPQLVAGPIVRAAHFLPQLENQPRFDDSSAQRGLFQILTGLFKKLCIADLLGHAVVDPVFANPSAHTSGTLLIAAYAYAFQIYYDFSGYSDVAIGAARMLGFDLPINFDRPYLATSLRNFWRRWHISLSTWLRDYLYVPLGGGKSSVWKTSRNLTIVMLLGGLWHGAAWGFVVWGAAHGMLLGLGRLFHHFTGIDADDPDQSTVARLARIAVTFHLVACCFVVFRAERLASAGAFLGHLLSDGTWSVDVPGAGLWVLVAAATMEWCPRSLPERVQHAYLRAPILLQSCVNCALLAMFAVVTGNATPFIYFQF
ncbi:MAG: MBOAT family O-acyltransferase [Phycisphaerae bacterium]